MRPGQPIETRDQFVHARVVLHGAAAKRIKAEIDRVIPGGKAREVADGFHFADFREAFDFGTNVGGAKRGFGIDRGDIEFGKLITALAGGALFEEQGFVLRDVRADFADHLLIGLGKSVHIRAAGHFRGAE